MLFIILDLVEHGMYLGMWPIGVISFLRCFIYTLGMILLMLMVVSGKAVEAGFVVAMI